jgi:hypothetical protein
VHCKSMDGVVLASGHLRSWSVGTDALHRMIVWLKSYVIGCNPSGISRHRERLYHTTLTDPDCVYLPAAKSLNNVILCLFQARIGCRTSMAGEQDRRQTACSHASHAAQHWCPT